MTLATTRMTRVRVPSLPPFIGTRYVEPNPKHPAKFSEEIIDAAATAIAEYGIPGRLVLDPCAGVGNVHRLPPRLTTVSVELEPEWVAQTLVTFGDVEAWRGDATQLPAKWRHRFACVFTSPVYGNRMSDSHDNRDKCKTCNGHGRVRRKDASAFGPRATAITEENSARCTRCGGSGLSSRRSYTHDLGHTLTSGNAGRHYYWQPEYRDLQRAMWEEVERVLKPGGLFLLNVKDFVKGQERQRVSSWHLRTCEALGFTRLDTVAMPHPGLRHGANRERVTNELLYVLRKAA